MDGIQIKVGTKKLNNLVCNNYDYWVMRVDTIINGYLQLASYCSILQIFFNSSVIQLYLYEKCYFVSAMKKKASVYASIYGVFSIQY